MIGADRRGQMQGWHIANEMADSLGREVLAELAERLSVGGEVSARCRRGLDQVLSGEMATTTAYMTLSELRAQGYAHLEPEDEFIAGVLTGIRQRFYLRVFDPALLPTRSA